MMKDEKDNRFGAVKIASPPFISSNDARHAQPWRTARVDWHGDWREASWEDGRVLLIDCVRRERLEAGRAKVVAQEFRDLAGLEKFYHSSRVDQAALRLIHVQNAPWATTFLLDKFSINDINPLVGTDFARWLKWEKPELRAGKPLLKGRTWSVNRDPWRKISKTAFGLDYLKEYRLTEPRHARTYFGGENRADDLKMMELNRYDRNDSPMHGYDVYVQRISVYVQKEDKTIPPRGVPNPYSQQDSLRTNTEKANQATRTSVQLPSVESLDNGNTVIVFESSETRSAQDTLVQARRQIESRWRRLIFFLPPDDSMTDEILATEGINVILEDIFKGLLVNWEGFLNISESHINILEDKIYESPADETRAPELWTNSAMWLKVEKLAYIHLDIVKEMLIRLSDMCDHNARVQKWLDGIVEEYQKLANRVQEDLVKPTTNLSDLLYQSVQIRDARHSLQLNMSLWRLSWITFIFLPLTFVVGFFGMNVDSFGGHVKLVWYFAAALLTMLVVLIAWYFIKHSLTARRQTPYVRGVYEHMYHDMTLHHGNLWTREGPKSNVEPPGLLNRIRWRLIELWFDPRKTINRERPETEEDAAGSGISTWARLKRSLARQWTSSIDASNSFEMAPPSPGTASTEIRLHKEPFEAAQVTVTVQSPVDEHVPGLGQPVVLLSPPGTSSGIRDNSRERASSSGGSSGIMVEEWNADDEEEESQMSNRMTTIDRLMNTVGKYT